MIGAALVKLVLGPIMEIAGKYIDKQSSRDALQSEIQIALIGAGESMAKEQASIIIAESRGESWLQRSWRPISALCFLFIAVWFGWLQPAAVAWFGVPPLSIGDVLLLEIVGLLKLCLGGYIGGRTLEKVASSIWRK